MANQPAGFNFDKNFALQMAAAQGMAAAQMFKMKDADNVGLDDLLGVVFQTAAEVAARYANPDFDAKNADQNLLSAYQALGSYLKQRGVVTGD